MPHLKEKIDGEKVLELAGRLIKLNEDAQPGLFIWQKMCHDVCRELADALVEGGVQERAK